MWLMPVSIIAAAVRLDGNACSNCLTSKPPITLRHPELGCRLSKLSSLRRLADWRDAAGLADLVRVAVGVPGGSPVPYIAGHVIKAVRVRRERCDFVSGIGFPLSVG